jgi:hypothetical protein
MPKAIVLARVAFYRRKGINLKKLPRSATRSLDVDEINRLIGAAGPEPEKAGELGTEEEDFFVECVGRVAS